jgi:hypothetical protein
MYFKMSGKITKVSLVIILLVLCGTSCAQTNWRITDDFNIRFTGTGAEGTFGGLSGTILFEIHLC